MTEMRLKAIIFAGISVLGIGLLSFLNPAAESPGSDARPTPGSGWKQDLVQLPKAPGGEGFGEELKPTGAPPSGTIGESAREAASAVEARPTEDPYAG